MESTKTVAAKEMRWAKGHKMTVHDWMRCCEFSSDSRFQNLFFSMNHAMSTGRLPNWERGKDSDRFFTKDGTRMSNTQVRNTLARAAQSQEKMTTAAGTKALQREFGVTVR